MNTKDKGAITAPEEQDKGNSFSLVNKVLEIFKSGVEITAFGLNQAVYFNDARKIVSMLRGRGYPIRDRRLLDRRKVYSMPSNWEQIMRDRKPIEKQLELFPDYD